MRNINVRYKFTNIQDVKAYRENYEICQKYMYYAKREMNCSHPRCPIGGCRITFKADPNQSVGTVSIPSYIIQGFKPEEVFWNEEEKVGQRRCSTSSEKYWYLDVVEMSLKSQRNDQFQPTKMIRTISKQQILRRVRTEINKFKKTEQFQLSNGTECKLETIKQLSGCNDNIPGKYLNKMMPQQENMKEIVEENILSLLNRKSNQMILKCHRIDQQNDPTTYLENDDNDTGFCSQVVNRKIHSLSSLSHYNLSDIDLPSASHQQDTSTSESKSIEDLN